MAKIGLSDLRARASTVDRDRLAATTEAQIEAYQVEDGFADLPVPEAARTVEPPRALRVRLGLTQREMADALRVPLGTWRNWEQGRVGLEPAAASLLAVVSRIPEQALASLATIAAPDAALPPAGEARGVPDVFPTLRGASEGRGDRPVRAEPNAARRG